MTLNCIAKLHCVLDLDSPTIAVVVKKLLNPIIHIVG